MDTFHSLGPWRIHPDTRHGVFVVAAGEELETSEFSVFGNTVAEITEFREPHQTEQNANAQLIAAAPELLQALATCADRLQMLAILVKHSQYVGSEVHQMVLEAYALIEKAGGVF